MSMAPDENPRAPSRSERPATPRSDDHDTDDYRTACIYCGGPADCEVSVAHPSPFRDELVPVGLCERHCRPFVEVFDD